MNDNSFLPKVSPGEQIEQPFPKIIQLFNFAAQNGLSSESSETNYYERKVNPEALPIPEELSSLTREYPGDFNIVYYTDRRDPYYKAGRGRYAGLSTSEGRHSSNNRLMELVYSQEESGNNENFFFSVSQKINQESFSSINNADNSHLETPYGEAKIKYQLLQNGAKEIAEARMSRLDEIMINFRGSNQPVRWVREVDSNLNERNDHELITHYRDNYIIGRNSNEGIAPRCNVHFTIEGSLDLPKKIIVEIGVGAPSNSTVLYKNSERDITILLHKDYERSLDILNIDQSYSFLNNLEHTSPDNLQEFITQRIIALQDHWDKPATNFSGRDIEALTPQLPA